MKNLSCIVRERHLGLEGGLLLSLLRRLIFRKSVKYLINYTGQKEPVSSENGKCTCTACPACLREVAAQSPAIPAPMIMIFKGILSGVATC